LNDGEKFDFIDDFVDRQRWELVPTLRPEDFSPFYGEKVPAGG